MPAATRPRSTKSKFRLLYLGADLELVFGLRQVLKEPDYRLVTCSDRGSAVLLLKSEIQYHLLLIDLEWRDVEDLKLAQLARSLRHRKRMPIILVAATELSDELQALARKAGVTDWVAKTRDISALSKRICRLSEG